MGPFKFTFYLQYGYHISVLNQIQAVITCNNNHHPLTTYLLPTCLPMSPLTFSLVTSIFTIGGLLGSLFANLIMVQTGRKSAATISALFTASGAAIIALSSSVIILSFGR